MNNWSPTILRVGETAIKVHVSFVLLLAFEAWVWREQGIEGMLFGMGLTLLLFTCVILHELGHALAARSVGIPVTEILLLPIGGIAFLSRLPRKPLHELWIAAAGPLVNVAIALVLAPFAWQADFTFSLPAPGTALSWQTVILAMFTANVMLVLFNLLPAFPLDGGRILRALLSLFAHERTATTTATIIGQAVAVIIGVLGIMSGNVLLALTAVFIFISANNEKSETNARTVLETRRVGDAYNRHAITLAPNDRVSRVVEFILTSYQPDFAVMQGRTLLGIVTRDDVMDAMANDPRDLYVAGIMDRDILRVAHTMTLDEVRVTLLTNKQPVAAVYEHETYLGLISLTDIAEALAVIDYVERQKLLVHDYTV
jgi:Zn-dependent protease